MEQKSRQQQQQQSLRRSKESKKKRRLMDVPSVDCRLATLFQLTDRLCVFHLKELEKTDD